MVEDELEVTDVTRDVLDSIQNPELPYASVTRPLARPLFAPVRMLTAALLPERLRRELGSAGALAGLAADRRAGAAGAQRAAADAGARARVPARPRGAAPRGLGRVSSSLRPGPEARGPRPEA